jgi:nicotinamidase-related amidase
MDSTVAARLTLDPARTGLLVIDVQERLAAVMPDDVRATCERRIGDLVALARELALPVIVTEQYPKGLGPTVEPVRAALAALPAHRNPIAKLSFDCLGEPAFAEALAASGRDQWVLAGMETHVCVFQTARSLAARGLTVHVPEDAVASRRPASLQRGLELIAGAGAVITTTETVIFDLLGRSGTPAFKALSARLREP